jgi:Rod binding domain-containing protein
MTFPPPQALAPLDLDRTPRAAVRSLIAGDLVPGVRSPGAPQTQHDRLVDQTRNWVAQTFFGTLLKQMENSPFKSDLFSGGRGGQAFRSLYHQQLAQRIAHGAGNKLVNAIVRKIESRQASKVEGAGAQDRPDNDLRGRRPATRGARPRHHQRLDLLS